MKKDAMKDQGHLVVCSFLESSMTFIVMRKIGHIRRMTRGKFLIRLPSHFFHFYGHQV